MTPERVAPAASRFDAAGARCHEIPDFHSSVARVLPSPRRFAPLSGGQATDHQPKGSAPGRVRRGNPASSCRRCNLARDELGDGERDHIGGAAEVGDQTARLGAGETPTVPTQSQLNLVGVDGVDVEVDGDPVEHRRAGGPEGVRGNTVRPQSSAISGRAGSVQSCIPTRATRSVEVVAGRRSRTSRSPCPVSAETTMP
jgi:hypothetical protein